MCSQVASNTAVAEHISTLENKHYQLVPCHLRQKMIRNHWHYVYYPHSAGTKRLFEEPPSLLPSFYPHYSLPCCFPSPLSIYILSSPSFPSSLPPLPSHPLSFLPILSLALCTLQKQTSCLKNHTKTSSVTNQNDALPMLLGYRSHAACSVYTMNWCIISVIVCRRHEDCST